MNTASLQLQAAAQQDLNAGNKSYLDLTGDITIEAWVKITGNSISHILAKDSNLAGFLSYMLWVEANGFTHFSLSGNGSGYSDCTSGSGISPDTWHHIAGVYTHSTDTALLYIDLSLAAQVTNFLGGGSINSNGSDINIGHRQGTSNYADAKLDELRLWNTARTLQQLSDNWKRELAGTESGLIIYFPFDNSFADKGPNNLGVNLSGTPSFSTDVPFADNTTTSTSTTVTTSSTSTTTTTTTSTSTSTTTSTTTTNTSTSTTTTTTSTSSSTTTTSTSTSTTTTLTSTSTSSSTSTSTSTTITIPLRFVVERVK